MSILTGQQIAANLEELPGWQLQDAELIRNVMLLDFPAAIAFINRVAQIAEAADHHPDIDIRYNKVRLALVTHSEGGVTEKDISLANSISALL